MLQRRWPHILAVVIAAVIGLLVILPPESLVEWLTGTTETPPIRSIALLPLENLTGDPEQAYFVDGLHEELIATFALISAFDKVIARTSVMGFRGSDTPIREIGEQLAVDVVLEGSVRRSGDTVRATLWLIDARTEEHLWADSFERRMRDVLSLQSDVVRAVATEVELSLTPAEEARLASTQSVNEEAYEAYLKGAHVQRTAMSSEQLALARGYYELAIEKDPDWAPPYVGLSISLRHLAHRYRPSSEVMPQAYEAVLKALERDNDLPSAYSALGTLKYWWQWDWQGAEAAFQRALDLDPNDVSVLGGYSQFLAVAGRGDEAVALRRRACELGPLSSNTLGGTGIITYFTRRYDEGIDHLRKTLELFPNDPQARWALSFNLAGAGRYAEAKAAIERVGELHPSPDEDPQFLYSLTWILNASGHTERAREAFQRLVDVSRDRHVPKTYLAYAACAMGDYNGAIEYLEAAVEERDTQLVFGCAAPLLDPLREDPRFQEILRRVNFPVN